MFAENKDSSRRALSLIGPGLSESAGLSILGESFWVS